MSAVAGLMLKDCSCPPLPQESRETTRSGSATERTRGPVLLIGASEETPVTNLQTASLRMLSEYKRCEVLTPARGNLIDEQKRTKANRKREGARIRNMDRTAPQIRTLVKETRA
jgi:hypothetical protein